MPTTKTKQSPRMSDESVKATTGKTWKQWFTVLDKAGAKRMSHQETVRFLNSEHGVGSWWQQMITVAYQQHTGLRKAHERPDGYQISVSRTVNATLGSLYKAFATEKSRKGWLDESGLAVRTATPNKSMRVTWKDRKTSLEISFSEKGANKSQVVVQHSKLLDAKAAAKMKTYWGEKLNRLKTLLE